MSEFIFPVKSLFIIIFSFFNIFMVEFNSSIFLFKNNISSFLALDSTFFDTLPMLLLYFLLINFSEELLLILIIFFPW